MVTGNFSHYLLSRGADDDVAVVEGTHRYSYADLRRAVGVLTRALGQRRLPEGRRIAVLGGNSFFWIAGYLAALEVGTAVPLSDKLPAAELAAQLHFVDCSTVLIDRRIRRRLQSGLDGIELITDELITDELITDELITDELITDEVLADEVLKPGDQAAAEPTADAVLLFTSGTTARPKAVRVTHANLWANTVSIVSYLGLDRSDRMLVILPFHYCFGASLLHTHLAVGAAVVLCNSFTFPETALDLIDRESCTGFAGVPSSFQLLLRVSSYGKRKLPTLRTVQQAGGRLSPDALTELAAAQPQSKLYVMYGQTEATARLSFLPPDRLVDKRGSIGRGIPGVELTVLDDAGREVGVGEQGEIVARGASISPGYYRDPAATAQKFRDGGLRTGDLATVDDDGFIYITGRSDDFIKSWGHRIAPQQIEEVVAQFGGVADNAAIGVPDPAAGESIALAVVAASDADFKIQDLLEFLQSRLAKHMIPHRIELVPELPLNANGKVSRPLLRSLLDPAARS